MKQTKKKCNVTEKKTYKDNVSTRKSYRSRPKYINHANC